MSAVIPFDFDGATVRLIDQGGEPWFVAADACNCLGLDDTSKACSRLDEDEKGTSSVRTLSGEQQMLVISESGLYSLILTSRKPEAKRFKKWVTSEVLPSIRRTGEYKVAKQQPTAVVAALLAIGKAVSKVPGVKPELAMSLTLATIEKTTGLPATEMRLALPGAAIEEAKKLNPTQLGDKLGKSARQVNAALIAMDMQQKDARNGYVLTDAGMKHGEMTPYTRGGHSGYQVLWYESVQELLREYFDRPAGNVIPMPT